LYHIQVSNPKGKETGVTRLKLNGEEIPEKQVVLNDNGGIYKIEIEI